MSLEMESLLAPGCVRCRADANSRKQALDLAAGMLARAQPRLSAHALLRSLMERERLGSTGIGEGVAIPHCRDECPRTLGVLMSLARPVNFNADDGVPVDLLFVLVAPRDEPKAHLEVLALLAAVFADERERSRLRSATSAEALGERFLAAARRRP